VLACVVNVSEGRSAAVLDDLAAAAGADLLDRHVDPFHHRAVLTLVGEDAPRAVAAEAVRRIDLRRHAGAHPRLGAVDVVPFVPLAGSSMADAVAARDRFSAWAAGELRVPTFRYGPDGRTLPEVRRTARRQRPDDGGPLPHPTAGTVAVGARDPLVAYNVVLAEADLGRARAVAAAVRGPAVRALGLAVGDEVQVSMNLVAPEDVGPAAAHDAVAARAPVRRVELVGLVPEAVLRAVDPGRWAALDLAADRTIEARLAAGR
jgi:glutamate formiminotransferase / 5-formyltetrahydrofolate cyclo-ligase